MDKKIEDLVNTIMELNEMERIEFINTMKRVIYKWKERNKSELRWMEQLEKMGFKREEEKEINEKDNK